MPFYLRKSVSVGPFRFNLSKSGLGVSAGVKGLRVGTGPRGNYIHMGRGGLYYRQTLNQPRRRGGNDQTHRYSEKTGPTTNGLEDVETGDLAQIATGRSEDIIEEINAKQSRLSLWPFLATITIAAVWYLYSNAISPNLTIARGALSLCAIIGLSATYLAYRRDQIRKSVVLLYHLDEDGLSTFTTLVEEFDRLMTANKAWCIDAKGNIDDWKQHGGATKLVKRVDAGLCYATPRIIKTNMSIPAISGGKRKLYFLPDVLLIREGLHYAAVSYIALESVVDTTRFVEDGRLPGDAHVVDHTWLHPNKSGGPDRRFSHNRQIPVALYQTIEFVSRSGVAKLLHVSKNDSRSKLLGALKQLGDIASRKPRFELQPIPDDMMALEGVAEIEAKPKSMPKRFMFFGVGLALSAAVSAIVFVPANQVSVLWKDAFARISATYSGNVSARSPEAIGTSQTEDRSVVEFPPVPTEADGPAIARETQMLLIALGYELGPIDGIVGPVTSNAIREYQAAHGLNVTGRATPALLEHLRQNAEIDSVGKAK